MEYKPCVCAKCKLKRELTLSELIVKSEHYQRDYFLTTLGNLCELCEKNTATCLDHCFSRMVRQLFFEKANLIRICPSCHLMKSKQWNGMHLKVYDHIKKREGIKKFEEMWQLDKNRKPWPKWNREYVESKLNYYKNKIKSATGANET